MTSPVSDASDRELLELAARAAGMFVLAGQWPDVDGWFFCPKDGKPALHFRKIDNPHHRPPPWMPLTDDGDAFRLAVKLRLSVVQVNNEFVAVETTPPHDGSEAEWNWFEDYANHPDEYAATRRAITRAAAEIGRTT